MNLPNKLTLLRVLMVPLFIGCFYLKVPYWSYIAAGIFVLAYATDVLDGKIARARNLVTDFGKLMDPIADKLLSASALIMLAAVGLLHPVAAIIIVAREFFISGFRLVSAGSGVVIAASSLGKLKTISQFVAITLTLLHDLILRLCGFPLDSVAVWISVLLTVVSAADYIKKNLHSINWQ
ncbi:MAG: CDP-diacylglycerol--glycerol-3-phosphate 3-phosphatidyltransferase [Christensenellaceae bacterium]|nr:CDP-diacylglycerol--glycerol-3-phosphate 3-phosphatidyltransferase [Christensenellaceae bacterium]